MKPKHNKIAAALTQFIEGVAPVSMRTNRRPLSDAQQGQLHITEGSGSGQVNHFKGKRSRRRRAARLRAQGLVHVDGQGWCKPVGDSDCLTKRNQGQP